MWLRLFFVLVGLMMFEMMVFPMVSDDADSR